MSRCRLLVTESRDFAPAAAAALREWSDVILADLDRPGLLDAVADVTVLWVRLRHRIDAEVMDAAPGLQLIVTATTGLNHIEAEEAARRGIRVVSLRGEHEFLDHVVATAEHTLALAFALLRHLPAASRHVIDGGWDRDRFKGAEIRGKIVGVVGYGRLGRIVARYFSMFGATIIAADPDLNPAMLPLYVRPVSTEELLAEADLVTVHVDLRDDNVRFLGRDQFAAMRRGAWFINTSRGELVDEPSLFDALVAGHLAGAALDVLTDEHAGNVGARRLVEYARTHENLIITPHIGGCTHESMEKTEEFLASRLRQALRRSTTSDQPEGSEVACAE